MTRRTEPASAAAQLVAETEAWMRGDNPTACRSLPEQSPAGMVWAGLLLVATGVCVWALAAYGAYVAVGELVR